MKTARVQALEAAVIRYERSLENLAAISEELRRLPPSHQLSELLKLTEATLRSTELLVGSARERLARESGAVATDEPQGNISRQLATDSA